MNKFILSLISLLTPLIGFAQEPSTSEQIDATFRDYTGWFVNAIFYEIPFSEEYRIPWVLIVLVGGAVFFTIYFKFINFKGFFTSGSKVVE